MADMKLGGGAAKPLPTLAQDVAAKAAGSASKAQKAEAVETEDQAAKPLSKLQQAMQQIQTTDEHAHSISSGSSIGSISIFKNPSNEIIDDAMNRSMAKYPGSQRDALNGFHKEISRMTQDQLDEMKDTIVKRMSSDESSQWDRDLLQKMYDITDAVSEHRPVPHIENKLDPWEIHPPVKPPIHPIHPKDPWGPINIKPGIGEPPRPVKPIHPLHPHEIDPFNKNLFSGESGGGAINKLEE